MTADQWQRLRTWMGKHRAAIESAATLGDILTMARRPRSMGNAIRGTGINDLCTADIEEMARLMKIKLPTPNQGATHGTR